MKADPGSLILPEAYEFLTEGALRGRAGDGMCQGDVVAHGLVLCHWFRCWM